MNFHFPNFPCPLRDEMVFVSAVPGRNGFQARRVETAPMLSDSLHTKSTSFVLQGNKKIKIFDRMKT